MDNVKPYEGVEIYGPYTSSDGRVRMQVNRKTISYPKYLMERHLCRYLNANEVVHHVDENPLNNDISNLLVMDRDKHTKMHQKTIIGDILSICFECGISFTISEKSRKSLSKNKWRVSKYKQKSDHFCSRRCVGLYGARVLKENKQVLVTQR